MNRKSEITAKVLVLVIAIFLWSYVMSEVDPVITPRIRNVKITFSNTAALERNGYVNMGPEEIKIDVWIKGKKSEIDKKFDSSKISASVDLSGYTEGQVKVPIMVGLLDQTAEVFIDNWEPKEALFTIDKIVTKEVPVTVTTSGQLPDTYVLGNIVSRPQTVLLRGPRTWLNEVSRIIAIVDILGKTETLNMAVPIKAVDDEGEEVRGVEREPGIVDMTVPIYKTARVPIELLTENELPENFSLVDMEISPSEVMIKGDKSVDTIFRVQTVPVDVLDLLDKDSHELKLSLPTGMELLNPDIKINLTYKVEETIEQTMQFTLDQIRTVNIPSGLELDELDNDLVYTVILKGYKSVLEETDIIRDLKPTVDLRGLEAGLHQLEIEFIQSGNITVETVNPNIVEINLLEE